MIGFKADDHVVQDDTTLDPVHSKIKVFLSLNPELELSKGLEPLKARNDEWVRARPDVSSTVLLWTRDIARPKGIVTEKRFLCRRGELWTGLWSG